MPQIIGPLSCDFASDFIYKEEALQAMNNISSSVAVQFHPKETYNKDYVHFIHTDGNYSNLGSIGEKQDISIAKNQGSVTGIIMHELLHALGLFHEMCRADRNEYIEILWDNIEANKKSNFQTYIELNTPGADIGNFDFNSIMMYPSNAFGKQVNGVQQKTIYRKDGLSYYAQRSYLTDSDITALRAIYGPHMLKSNVSRMKFIHMTMDTIITTKPIIRLMLNFIKTPNLPFQRHSQHQDI